MKYICGCKTDVKYERCVSILLIRYGRFPALSEEVNYNANQREEEGTLKNK